MKKLLLLGLMLLGMGGVISAEVNIPILLTGGVDGSNPTPLYYFIEMQGWQSFIAYESTEGVEIGENSTMVFNMDEATQNGGIRVTFTFSDETWTQEWWCLGIGTSADDTNIAYGHSLDNSIFWFKKCFGDRFNNYKGKKITKVTVDNFSEDALFTYKVIGGTICGQPMTIKQGSAKTIGYYGGVFSPTEAQKNIFRMTNFAVGDYEKIVIKFAEAVPTTGDWRLNNNDGLTALEGKTEVEFDLDGTAISDFTIFNMSANPDPIKISEVYFYKEDVDPGVPTLPEGWTNCIINGTFNNGSEVTGVWQKDENTNGDIQSAIVTAGVGRDKSAGLHFTSKEDANANEWDTQFFIGSSAALPEGTRIHIEFDYKADKAATVSSQSQKSLGGYLGGGVGDINFTTSWQHFEYDLMTENDETMAFAFNLNKNKEEAINFYLDNVVMWIRVNPITKPNRTEENALELDISQFSPIDDGASWDSDTREFKKKCGWQWTEGINLSQYRYLVITAAQNYNADGQGEISLRDNLGKIIKGDDYGDDFRNMYFSVWNYHNCCKIDLEKLRKEQEFNIYDIRELTINGGSGFLLGNVYASNQEPGCYKNWNGEDDGDFKIENLTVDKFGTICLPFQAAIADAFAYTITGKTASGITLERVDGLLEAGKPYIYKTNVNKNESNTTYAVRFYKATAATVAEPVANNGLIGTFGNPSETEYVPLGNDNYVIGRAANATEDKLYQVDQTVTLGANRAYINMAAITNKPANSRTLFVSFDGAEENDPTAIEGTEAVEVLTEGVFYDMSGREVKNPTTGVYIVKYGNVTKKVMIK